MTNIDQVGTIGGEHLPKTPTGIKGLDQITGGGLPAGRPTLVAGTAGSGKTLLGVEFLIRGVIQYDEPGVFMPFEETAEELTQNVRSLGYDMKALVAARQIVIDHIHIERSEIEETGEYDLEGLFIRLGHAIDSIGAKRVVLDTLEAVFAGLPNEMLLRAELRRLFRWLKQKGVTAIITAERGHESFTRYGLEEYVSDCVIVLDHRVTDQISTRRLRVVKYRGSVHGTNEYPFLIDEKGFSVLPITSLGLDHLVSDERISTGISELDQMLGSKGLYRGSSVLISGTAGTGKTSIASHMANATAARGERCLYFAFEESPAQILRNMRSIGLNLAQWVDQDLLRIQAARPTIHGLEMHLVMIHKLIEEFQPSLVVIDPITDLTSVGEYHQVKSVLMRLVDYLKTVQITAIFTSLTTHQNSVERSEVGISSLLDTWIKLKRLESNGEQNLGLYIIKSRGMAHSNQIREFKFSDKGIELIRVYLGSTGVLTGTARITQEARERSEARARQQEVERMRRTLERKRQAMEAQIATLKAQFAEQEEDVLRAVADINQLEEDYRQNRNVMAYLRGGSLADQAEDQGYDT